MHTSSRRDRRAGSRRERKRLAEDKTEQFLHLREQGLSRATIASKLNYTTAVVDELFAALEEHDRQSVTEGGGG